MQKTLVPQALALLACAALAAFGLASGHVQAQADATPTLAPTKTPTPAVTQVEATTAPTRDARPSQAQSFTQRDLAILTGNVQRPNGLTWFDDKLYAACTGDWTVYELDSRSGQTVTYIYGIRNAHTLHAERQDDELNLWIPDFQNNSLARVTRNGVVQVNEEMNGPWGILYWNTSEFLVSNMLGNTVSRVNRDGEQADVILGLQSPTGLASDDEYLYVANTGSTRRAIEQYSLSELTNLTEPVYAAQPDEARRLVIGLQNTTGLAMGSDGYLYFAYALGTRGVVGRVNPEVCRSQGGCTPDQVEIVVLTELAAPLAGLTLSPDMRLYLHTIFSPDIYWVQLGDAPAAAAMN